MTILFFLSYGGGTPSKVCSLFMEILPRVVLWGTMPRTHLNIINSPINNLKTDRVGLNITSYLTLQWLAGPSSPKTFKFPKNFPQMIILGLYCSKIGFTNTMKCFRDLSKMSNLIRIGLLQNSSDGEKSHIYKEHTKD